MNIDSLIDNSAPSVPSRKNSVDEPKPPLSRRQTLAMVLNDDDLPANGAARPPHPKKYASPPVWAQRWNRSRAHKPTRSPASTPSSRLPTRDTKLGLAAGPPSHGGPAPMVARESVSISGSVPFEDLTRRITDWLYSHLTGLKENMRYAEVEFKMGTIIDKKNERRLKLPVVTETLIASNYADTDTRFQAGIGDQEFSMAERFLNEMVRSPGILTKGQDAMTCDLVYSSVEGAGVHGVGTGDVRVTLDQQDQVLECITKHRVANLVVFSPGDRADFRISLSTEIPFTEKSKVQGRRPVSERVKNRLTYLQVPGIRIDLTAVQAKGQSQAPMSKELEIELNSQMLVDCVEKKNGASLDDFEGLIRLGLDNMRLIARRLSRDA